MRTSVLSLLAAVSCFFALSAFGMEASSATAQDVHQLNKLMGEGDGTETTRPW